MIRLKKYLKYIIPSIITFIILGVIYYFNKLYPFGNKPLVQVDADYIYIPIMYKIWDILHHGGSIFYTNLGLGNSIYGSLIIQGSLYSPLNLILYLVSRDNLINFMGTFIIIKLCLLSLTSYIFINHKYSKIDYFYKVLFSILYTFSGYIILNYFNHIWLDIVIIFPILVIYLDKLLANKNIMGYVITLSLCLIISFYYSYFILIFIVFYSFIYLKLNSGVNYKDIIFKLGKGTIIAIMISAFSSFPLMYQILNSSRFHVNTSVEFFSNLPMKSLYIIFSPLLIIGFIMLLTKYKTNQKKIYSYAILVILYIIPIFIDPINALLHGGTYWSFPYRYGFITSFILMDACLYYIDNYLKIKEVKIDLYGKLGYLLIMLILSGLIYFGLTNRSVIIDKGILLHIDHEIYQILIYVGAILVAYILTNLIESKVYKYATITIISLVSIFLFTSLTIYHNSGYFLTTQAKELSHNIDFPNDMRYKVEYETYTPYYGLMYNVSAPDNWLHLIPSNVLENHKRLGYGTRDLRIYSYGGTIFSDYLLGLNYILSGNDKSNDDMYTLIDDNGSKYLYQRNYHINAVPFNELKDIKYDFKFGYQNDIYKNLFNSDKNIINYKEYTAKHKEEFTYKVTKPGYLYLDAPSYDNINSICINGDCIYRNGEDIKFLGYFDTDIKVRMNTLNNKEVTYYLGFINKDDIKNITSSVKYENNTYYFNNENNYKYLFIPINNIKGLKVYNNGKLTKSYNYLKSLTYIKLNRGENKITIKYHQPLFKLGLILSIIGVILLIINNKLKANKLVLSISCLLFNFITIFIFLYFYIYAIIKYLL